MADIFVSYYHKDHDRVAKIVHQLEAEGYAVWWDTRLHAGEKWDEVIERELTAARCVVVVWSADSVTRHWVREEATIGRERNILVPLTISDVEPPVGFRRIHTANLSSWDGDANAPALRGAIADVRLKLGSAAGPLPDLRPVTANDVSPAPPPQLFNAQKAKVPKNKIDLGFWYRIVRSFLLAALFFLFWFSAFDGTLKFIASTREVTRPIEILVGVSTATIVMAMFYSLNEIFTAKQKMSSKFFLFVLLYFNLSLILVGLDFGFYWRILNNGSTGDLNEAFERLGHGHFNDGDFIPLAVAMFLPFTLLTVAINRPHSQGSPDLPKYSS